MVQNLVSEFRTQHLDLIPQRFAILGGAKSYVRISDATFDSSNIHRFTFLQWYNRETTFRHDSGDIQFITGFWIVFRGISVLGNKIVLPPNKGPLEIGRLCLYINIVFRYPLRLTVFDLKNVLQIPLILSDCKWCCFSQMNKRCKMFDFRRNKNFKPTFYGNLCGKKFVAVQITLFFSEKL